MAEGSALRIIYDESRWPCVVITMPEREATADIVAIQVLDGVAAAIFGVVSVLVIADLTRGTGRFNLTLGAITTAVAIGASLSQVVAGSIAQHAGFRAAFLFLSVVAVLAFGIFYFFMPETNERTPTAP
jgi:predicted MFS family arabinose efflux permease